MYIGVFLFMYVLFFAPAHALSNDDELLESNSSAQKYILELSGSVLKEKFGGVIMALQFSGAPLGSLKPYQLIAQGFPDAQTSNSFFWNTEYSTMEVISNRITCTIRPGFPAAPDIHFFYFSPILFNRMLTHKDSEEQLYTIKTAKPIKVFAQAGELNVTISKGYVSGTVWLQGYDTVEHSYVRYNATFTGQQAINIEQKLERKK